MWIYQQKTGHLLSPIGEPIATGWSGCGENKNDPSKENVPHEGCIPKGDYHIGPAYKHEHLGPVVMNLTPIDPNLDGSKHEMYGRDLFRCHGAAADDPGTPINETEYSSHGCVIMPRVIREKIAASGDKTLHVIE
jgi:hypothetical protein